jgi:hypothetical protein
MSDGGNVARSTKSSPKPSQSGKGSPAASSYKDQPSPKQAGSISGSNESLTFCCDPLLGGLTGVVTPPLDPLLPRVVGREDFSGIGDALLGLFAALTDFCDETVLPFPLILPAC